MIAKRDAVKRVEKTGGHCLSKATRTFNFSCLHSKLKIQKKKEKTQQNNRGTHTRQCRNASGAIIRATGRNITVTLMRPLLCLLKRLFFQIGSFLSSLHFRRYLALIVFKRKIKSLSFIIKRVHSLLRRAAAVQEKCI